MNSYLIQSVCRTGIFVICAQVLVHFRPNASYEKYMKMLVSAIVLLQLFLPVSNLFAGEEQQSLQTRVEWFEEQLSAGMEQALQQYCEGESLLENMTLEEVRERLAQSSLPEVSGGDLDALSEAAAARSVEPVTKIQRIQIGLTEEGGANVGGERYDSLAAEDQ